jgi:hypothetical protein
MTGLSSDGYYILYAKLDNPHLPTYVALEKTANAYPGAGYQYGEGRFIYYPLAKITVANGVITDILQLAFSDFYDATPETDSVQDGSTYFSLSNNNVATPAGSYVLSLFDWVNPTAVAPSNAGANTALFLFRQYTNADQYVTLRYCSTSGLANAIGSAIGVGVPYWNGTAWITAAHHHLTENDHRDHKWAWSNGTGGNGQNDAGDTLLGATKNYTVNYGDSIGRAADSIAVDLVNSYLYDGAGSPKLSIDFHARNLYADDGTTPHLAYGVRTFYLGWKENANSGWTVGSADCYSSADKVRIPLANELGYIEGIIQNGRLCTATKVTT